MKMADASAAETELDFPVVVYKTRSDDGPCPMIVVEDHTHWRVICINARSKIVDHIDPFGTGFTPAVMAEMVQYYTTNTDDDRKLVHWEL